MFQVMKTQCTFLGENCCGGLFFFHDCKPQTKSTHYPNLHLSVGSANPKLQMKTTHYPNLHLSVESANPKLQMKTTQYPNLHLSVGSENPKLQTETTHSPNLHFSVGSANPKLKMKTTHQPNLHLSVGSANPNSKWWQPINLIYFREVHSSLSLSLCAKTIRSNRYPIHNCKRNVCENSLSRLITTKKAPIYWLILPLVWVSYYFLTR
jgi:hypothetical protein